MGPEEWAFVPEKHGIPSAVAGFETDSLLAALYSVLRQHLEGRVFLDNCYANVAKPGGNPTARQLLGRLAGRCRCELARHRNHSPFGLCLEARTRSTAMPLGVSSLDADAPRKRAGEMPPGCDCARVVLGKIYPNQCVLFGKACTPRNPIGPCMVSDEGACRIWWSSGIRADAPDEHGISAILRCGCIARGALSSAGGYRASAFGHLSTG